MTISAALNLSKAVFKDAATSPEVMADLQKRAAEQFAENLFRRAQGYGFTVIR